MGTSPKESALQVGTAQPVALADSLLGWVPHAPTSVLLWNYAMPCLQARDEKSSLAHHLRRRQAGV